MKIFKMIVMGRSHLPLFCSLLLCLHLGCISAEDIIARVGTDATLLCKYDSSYYGRLPVCWGQGSIPNRGCGNELIKSDGTSVVSRLSERYLLSGDLGRGDVSLTIRQVDLNDSGIYGCRVDIPGWFNDQKHHVKLSVVAARPTFPRVEAKEVKERHITVHWTPAFDGGRPITSYIIDLKNKQESWASAIRTEISNLHLTEVTLLDLNPAKTYNIRVFVVNSVGMSDSSNVLTVTTKEAAPLGPPMDVELVPLTPNSIKVTWKPPKAHLRNGVVRSYSISYRAYDPVIRTFQRWQHQSVTVTQEVESVILNNLKPSTKYGVIIQAINNAGVGPPSNSPFCSTLDEVLTTSAVTTVLQSTSTAVYFHSTMQTTTGLITVNDDWKNLITPSEAHTHSQTPEPVTPAMDLAESTTGFTSSTSGILGSSSLSVPPDPPVVELKEVIDDTISLFWTPGFEGDSPITGYYLEYKALNASWDYTKTVVDFSRDQREATIIEIHPSIYNIRMFAKNSLGTSKPSNVLTITTGEPGHYRDSPDATVTTDPHFTAVGEEANSGHQVAIVVLVVLVLLVVGTVTAWQLRRMKHKQGHLSMWVAGGALRYRDSEPLQEL